jgi:hypothetical protein
MITLTYVDILIWNEVTPFDSIAHKKLTFPKQSPNILGTKVPDYPTGSMNQLSAV